MALPRSTSQGEGGIKKREGETERAGEREDLAAVWRQSRVSGVIWASEGEDILNSFISVRRGPDASAFRSDDREEDVLICTPKPPPPPILLLHASLPPHWLTAYSGFV